LNNQTVHKSEVKIGNTRYIVTEKCSPNARETIDEKLLKIMSRHILDGFDSPENSEEKPCNVS